MKTLLKIIFILLLLSNTATAQNWTQPNPGTELEQRAQAVTENLSEQLVLSPKQETLMKKVLIEFAMKKNRAIQSDLSKEEKDRIVLELQEKQFSDMRDVLTKPQYDKYLQLSEEANKQLDRD